MEEMALSDKPHWRMWRPVEPSCNTDQPKVNPNASQTEPPKQENGTKGELEIGPFSAFSKTSPQKGLSKVIEKDGRKYRTFK